MLVNLVVDDNKAKIYLDKLTPRIISEVKAELNHQAQEMRNLMQESFLTGGPVGGGSYSSRLRVRSGTLRKSLGIIPTTVDKERVSTGIHVGGGVPYARVHINKFGTVTTISGHPWLTVPALGGPAYRGRLGQGGVKYARSIDFPHLVYVNIKGHPALVRGEIGPRGKLVPTKVKGRIKPVRGGLEVVYWLLRSVRVPARVHPEWIVNLRSKFIYYGIKEAVARATTP
jgi:hypothetical protein